MSINEYFSVAKNITDETIIERSRFIAEVFSVKTEEDARREIERIRKAHPFASHNCYAYIVSRGEISRFSDDGEPQGTAGMPMLEVIKNKKLVDTLVVVTRYFGGVKLGAGGLVRAYSGSTACAISKAGVNKFVLSNIYSLDFPYDKYSGFLKLKESLVCKIKSQSFGDGVSLVVASPVEKDEDFISKLTDFTAGKLAISRLSSDFENYGEEI